LAFRGAAFQAAAGFLAGFPEMLTNFSGFAGQLLRDTKPEKFNAHRD
jgi:hypothetical protein